MIASSVTEPEFPAMQDFEAAVDAACARIAPLWPLDSFVAVNPFAELAHLPFPQAAALLERVTHRSILMQPAHPAQWATAEPVLTVADFLDRSGGSNWSAAVTDEISKWCSSYFDHGQSAWRMPWRDLPLYAAWRQAAELDANPEALGLEDFRSHVKALPASADEAIAQALAVLGIGVEVATDFLHRQLMSVYGWSAYCAYHDRYGTGGSSLRDLLAIRLAWDTALFRRLEGPVALVPAASADHGTAARHHAQQAVESAFRNSLLERLRPGAAPCTARPLLQAAFCIDVRSEVFRRALEEQNPRIETIGFAGFFGMSLDVDGAAHCPVLLSPSHTVRTAEPQGVLADGVVATAWKKLSQSASACFSAIEVGGLWSAFELLSKTLASRPAAAKQHDLLWRLPTAEKVRLAVGALRNMSLDASRLAPVVLICGHGSRTRNNPYEASLDCGACGGHKGDVNARFAAAIFNDPAVRAALASEGMAIPDDTVFVAGLHITTTDEVILFDDQALPEEQRERLAAWLDAAGQRARLERGNANDAVRRSVDWSEVRPEWGLAGNAAFIAAPRAMTRGVNLEGRAFLHDYDAAADTDGSVLTLILTAPVIVASWINLQYYASVVNNDLFGSGNKVLHNVVGRFGIWEGNGGDLRTGLPLQSLHDGVKWMHEPLRLQVIVAVPRRRVDSVLQNHQGIRDLVENGWIDLLVLEDGSAWQCCRTGVWKESGHAESTLV